MLEGGGSVFGDVRGERGDERGEMVSCVDEILSWSCLLARVVTRLAFVNGAFKDLRGYGWMDGWMRSEGSGSKLRSHD